MLTRCLRGDVAVVCLIVIASLLVRAVAEPVVREQRRVIVEGVHEVWTLVWEGKPATVCGPEDISMAMTCPCAGLAYGEYGHLSLVRSRDDRDNLIEIERMDLRPLFGQFDGPGDDKVKDQAYMQRRPLSVDDVDREHRGDRNLVAEIERRSPPKIMTMGDYNRDGVATEFLVQVGTLPCGKLQFAAIGVSKKNPKLHALTTVAHRERPLVMPLQAWQALNARGAQSVVRTWACGDHGSETRSELVVSAKDGDIRVKARDFSCPDKGQAEKLVEETEQ